MVDAYNVHSCATYFHTSTFKNLPIDGRNVFLQLLLDHELTLRCNAIMSGNN